MPRPRRCRRIFHKPGVEFFKPAGVPMRNLRENILGFDELEAIRLIDSEQLDQTKAAEKMKISQSTLSRLLRDARKKISDAIVKGKAIRVQGGDYEFYGKRKR